MYKDNEEITNLTVTNESAPRFWPNVRARVETTFFGVEVNGAPNVGWLEKPKTGSGLENAAGGAASLKH